MVDGVRWYAALSQDEAVMPLPPLHYADWFAAHDLVTSGRVAMWIASTGVFGRPLELAVGATPLPVTGAPYTSFSTTGYALSAYTPYVQESWDWLVYMTRQPGLVRALPARRSLAEAASLPMIPRRRSRNCGKPWCHPSGLCRRLGRRHDHRPLARGGLSALSPGGT